MVTNDRSRSRLERRTLVRLLGGSAVTAVAGCVEGQGTSSQADRTVETVMPAESTTQTGDAPDADGLVTVESDQEFDATVSRIEAAIEASPLTLVTTVDHAANAAAVDRDLPPTTLFLFGNPDAGTPLMQEGRSIAIDLPQKLLVWEDDEQVLVVYNDPQYLADRHGLENLADRLEGLATGDSQ
jgi:uncharacterized protein (DUF302 family)